MDPLRTTTAALLLAGVLGVGAGGCGIGSAALCCRCLADHAPNGDSALDSSSEPIPEDNCLPPAETGQDQIDACSETVSAQMTEDEPTELEVTEASCIEEVCGEYCDSITDFHYRVTSE